MAVCMLSFMGVEGFCIPVYILAGLFLFLSGILTAVFVPTPFGKKLGISLILFGIILFIGIPLFGEFWASSTIFRYVIFSIGVIFLIFAILFPDMGFLGKK